MRTEDAAKGDGAEHRLALFNRKRERERYEIRGELKMYSLMFSSLGNNAQILYFCLIGLEKKEERKSHRKKKEHKFFKTGNYVSCQRYMTQG